MLAPFYIAFANALIKFAKIPFTDHFEQRSTLNASSSKIHHETSCFYSFHFGFAYRRHCIEPSPGTDGPPG
jgi:hypothetical protein